MNPFQIREAALSTILFREFSSSRLYTEIPSGFMEWPVSLLATALSKADFSAENIIWFHNVSRSVSEYIPLMAKGPGVRYLQVRAAMGLSC